MEYIIISIMTISIFTYIVYMLAKKLFSTQIHIKYFILCACCALVINLILPRLFIGSAGLTGTLGIVTIFAIISSCFIAYYYDNAMEKVALENDVATTLVEFPCSEPLQTDIKKDIQLTADLTTIFETNDLEMIVKITESTEVITDSIAKKYFYPMIYQEQDKPFNQMSRSVNVLRNIAEEPEELITMAESTLKQYNYPMIYEEYNPKILLSNIFKINEEVEVGNNLMNLTEQTDVINTPLVLEKFQEHLDVPNSNELSDSFPSSNDLDVLMDFAFLQKEQRNSLQALKAFRHALALYPDSEVSPFLVMEIATILKNLGSYNEAIKALTEGRLLPEVSKNSMLEQEFINNIAYLRVVKNILVKNSLEFMPYNLIPENAFKEIDAEFCEWRNQS